MYGKNWDLYYQRTYKMLKKKALWDVSAEEAVMIDQKYFEKVFQRNLPLIDLGCGTGTQTVYLSSMYESVLGVDASSEAISVAREMYGGKEGIAFDVLDGTDMPKAKSIHDRFGDMNIYMRGVLHQIKEEDISAFRKSLRTLLGKQGHLYCIEVSDKIREHFNTSEGSFNKLPQRMQQVFISNLPPKGLSLSNISKYFPDDKFKVILSGEARLNTNIQYSNEVPIYIPAVFVLIQNAEI